MKILVTMPVGVIRDSFITTDVIEKLSNMGDVIWNTSQEQFSKEELREKVRDVEVCITGWGCPRLDEYVLESAANLKMIAHTGGSVSNLVSHFLYERNIRVVSGNQIYAESVAEGVIGYIVSSLRDIPFYDNEMKNGGWRPDDYYNEGLLDQTIGLIGFGMIAKYLVKMLSPFRVKVKVCSGHIDEATLLEYGMEKASKEEIFKTCKIISLHSALRPETRHMIDKQLLQMIPHGSILINTARGGLIDEGALAEELEKAKFKAVLDVFEAEPLPAESKLRKMKNVILIPHMAGPTIDRRKRVTLELMEDIIRLFNGEEPIYEISKQYAAIMSI